MFTPNPLLSIALVMMSGLCFCLMATDKKRARKGQWRIPEWELFLTAVCFGAVGGTLAMFLCKHKTRHKKFRIGFPVLAVLHIVAVFLL